MIRFVNLVIFAFITTCSFAQKNVLLILNGDCNFYTCDLTGFSVYSDSKLIGKFDKTGTCSISNKVTLPLLISHPKFEDVVVNEQLKKENYIVTTMKKEEVELILLDFQNEQLATCTDSLEKEVYGIVDVQAEFPGGKAELMKFLAAHVRYPQYAVENMIQGKVHVSFIINENGTISCIQVKRGVHYVIDKEAFRVVKSLPNFKPATIGGTNVSSKFTLPISFKLN